MRYENDVFDDLLKNSVHHFSERFRHEMLPVIHYTLHHISISLGNVDSNAMLFYSRSYSTSTED
jgi:hypothetical protein